MVEMVVAMAVLAIALLALAAGFEEGALATRSAGSKTVAATIADKQMELYGGLVYSSIGLDSTTVTNTKTSGNGSYDATWVTDDASLSGTEVNTSCGSSANCLPVQTTTGSNGHSYKIETFVHDVTNVGTRTERIVTVLVRDLSQTGSPEVMRLTAGFDAG